ncbi:MAG: T9SS C-terminal target domain-containing protein [Chitinophagaceae bacterium]|nr:MAG: T9SS C-terminal target domain-containing protein [Chitinophagaceae bacterium]
MKKLILLFVLAFTINSSSFSQSSPTPFDLSTGSYNFTFWDSLAFAGTYPANMIFHQFLNVSNPGFTDEPDSDWACVYNLKNRSRIIGLGANGFVFINTNTAQDPSDCGNAVTGQNLGAAVLALNTTDRENIEVSFEVFLDQQGLGTPTPREYHLRFQYRLGASGSWQDLSTPVIYTSSGKNDGDTENFNVTLPGDAENFPTVELRWFYYQEAANDGGARPRIGINQIQVNSQSLSGPSITALPLSVPTFNTEAGTPSDPSTISVSGTLLTDNVNLTVNAPFEISENAGGPYSNSLVLDETAGSVGPLDIFVRYSPVSSGTHSEVLLIESASATPVQITLNGQSFSVTTFPNLFVNEFMASNNNTIADVTGEYEDWIEIYNAEDTAVNIGGFYLTDDLSEPDMHQLPIGIQETIIPAGGFLLIWASGDVSRGPLHTNFRLSAGGEQVGIYAPDGLTPIDTLTFGPQATDISQGRLPDGGPTWVFFSEPTPGTTNTPTGISEFSSFKNLNVFPNPFTNHISISGLQGSDYLVEWFNLTGQTLFNKHLSGENTVLDVSNMSAGVYILKITDKQNGEFYLKKLIAE